MLRSSVAPDVLAVYRTVTRAHLDPECRALVPRGATARWCPFSLRIHLLATAEPRFVEPSYSMSRTADDTPERVVLSHTLAR